jgi:anti-sigma factor RsiW
MTCQTAESLIEPWLDGELDASQKADVERHLADCANCAQIHQRLAALGNDLRALPLRYEASSELRTRVLSSVRRAGRQESSTPIGSWVPSWARSWAIAATVLLAVSAGWNVRLLQQQAGAGSEIAREIVSSHVRSLIGDHLLDIPSTDQHNVKPWFNGKLDYAPDVRDFAALGFPLIGGRVDYIDHRPIAALVYKRREHVINLFVWPSGSPLPQPKGVSGFNLAPWNKADLNYCAISDLNPAELKQFVDLYKR